MSIYDVLAIAQIKHLISIISSLSIAKMCNRIVWLPIGLVLVMVSYFL